MKLSLAWLCDHLALKRETINVDQLINKLNETVAEIESVTPIKIQVNDFQLVNVVEVSGENIVGKAVDTGKEYSLITRHDLKKGDKALIVQEDGEPRWATMRDLGSSRSDIMPAVFLPDNAINWRTSLEQEDFILELDNKSINHRPDLWGHRGFAREIAAILGTNLVPEDKIYADIKVDTFDQQSKPTAANPFTVEIKDQEGCRRLAALYFPQIQNPASHLFIASRLARLDARPITALVDLTNYVMFDIGQPLHAFDAQKMDGKNLIAQKGNNQTLELLDGDEVKVSPDDIVISDGQKPLALAGIMGGMSTAVDAGTTQVLLEAANFDAHTIRVSSMRVKKRTDASTRFEKSLDPNQNVLGLKRYLKLLQELKIAAENTGSIVSVGKPAEPVVITLSHDLIEKKLGFSLTQEFITSTLEALGFGVSYKNNMYEVTVPTYRATKDIKIKEDIVEEVGRFFLSSQKKFELPRRAMAPFDISEVQQQRLIKDTLASALCMHEVYNYSLYDQEFINKISYQPEEEIALKNPVSEHWRFLITSLIPHLLKNVEDNHTKADKLRFFELARVWHRNKNEIIERKKLAGIFWSKTSLDFFEMKSMLLQFFHALSLNVVWQKGNKELPWQSLYKTADVFHDGKNIGYVGMISAEFLAAVVEGEAFVFELDADFLLAYKPQHKTLSPLSKYQPVALDVSLFVPLVLTTAELEKEIQSTDTRIEDVQLVDFYEKPEWGDKRSLTFRFVVQDQEKTLSKPDIEKILANVHDRLTKLGGHIR